MTPTFELENSIRTSGLPLVAGVDEAGRGALAGPVVAGAVILSEDFDLPGVRDSKTIPEAEREALYERIVSQVPAWGVGIVENDRIDRINILQATFAAMGEAVRNLEIRPDFALIDGRDAPDVGVPCRGVIRGDSLSLSVAAASILAKVTRDRIMREHHGSFPRYGFDRNKGYGTKLHREAIQEWGPCTLHRLTFLGSLLQERLPL